MSITENKLAELKQIAIETDSFLIEHPEALAEFQEAIKPLASEWAQYQTCLKEYKAELLANKTNPEKAGKRPPNPLQRFMGSLYTKQLERPSSEAEEFERYFVLLTACHDHFLPEVKAISSGIWPDSPKGNLMNLEGNLLDRTKVLFDESFGDRTHTLRQGLAKIKAKPQQPLHETGDSTEKSATVTTTEEAEQAYQLYNTYCSTQTEVAKTMSKIKRKPYNQGQISRLIGTHKKFLEANGLPIAERPKIKKTALNPSIIDMGARTDGRKRPDTRNLKE